MKRIHVLARPMTVGDVYNLDLGGDAHADRYTEKLARLEVRRWRQLKHQLL